MITMRETAYSVHHKHTHTTHMHTHAHAHTYTHKFCNLILHAGTGSLTCEGYGQISIKVLENLAAVS